MKEQGTVSRAAYVHGDATNREFYGQFVTPDLVREVAARLGDRLDKSSDPHLNDIRLVVWDKMAGLVKTRRVAKLMREAGDYLTASGCVCILKEAAKQAIESKNSSAGI